MNNLHNRKEASVLHNLKFAPKSEEHSEAIQKKLFGMGYGWKFGVREVNYTHHKILYAYSDGDITHDDDMVRFAKKHHLNLTETFVPLKLKLDGTTSYLEGVDIPVDAEVAVTPTKYKHRIWFFKDSGNSYHDGVEWCECGEHYGHQNPDDKVIWQKDKSPPSKPSDVFGSDSVQERMVQCVIKNDDKVIFNLKLEYITKFLHGVDIQYRVGKAVGGDKSQWHKLTWESLKDMKHDIIEFREKPKNVSIDGVVFDTEESLLKYVRKNFDLK